MNHVDEEYDEILMADEDDEDLCVTQMAENGDEDAMMVCEYEGSIQEVVQDVPELASCYTAYVQARQRLQDKAKSRGFWPPRRKGKGGKASGRKGGKGLGNLEEPG